MTVLAGGIGSRFWPVSTPQRPKQLLPLGSDAPLIVDTIARARALVEDDRIRVLAGSHLVEPFRSAVPDLHEACYWVEPRARGTAPVLAWAARRLVEQDRDAVMVSLHSDHVIRPVDAFRETVAAAVKVARSEELLLCVGVPPRRVETAYGHVEPGEPLPMSGRIKAHRVGAFHEKPDGRTAKRYTESGFLWNTGIFVWKASVLLEELERHAPEIAGPLAALEDDPAGFFEQVPTEVIDRAVMERSDRTGVVEASFEWDDVGSWDALARTRPLDRAGNVTVGDARAVEATGNVLYADEGAIVVLGADDLVVVQSGGTTMVLPRARIGEMKTLLEQMRGSGT